MKHNKFAFIALASLALAACDMEDVVPQGGTLLATQVQETNLAAPSRAEATFSGMFTLLGEPLSISFSSSRPDNFGLAYVVSLLQEMLTMQIHISVMLLSTTR